MFNLLKKRSGRWLRRTRGYLALAGMMLLAAPNIAWGAQAPATASSGTYTAGQTEVQLAYDQFLASAEKMYDAVNGGRLQEALVRLKDVEQRYGKLPLKNRVSPEGVQALGQSIVEMKRTVAAVTPNEWRWKSGAAIIRLAADALAHPDKPLWRQYRTIFREDIDLLKKKLQEQGLGKQVTVLSKPAVGAYEQIAEHFRLIRTAALLSTDASRVEKADSVLRYADRVYHAQQPPTDRLVGVIASMQASLDALFPTGGDKSVLGAPTGGAPWSWTAMLGTFIVAVLAWAGWRRYRGDVRRGPPLA